MMGLYLFRVRFKHMLLRVVDVPRRTGTGLYDVHRSPDVPHDVTNFKYVHL